MKSKFLKMAGYTCIVSLSTLLVLCHAAWCSATAYTVGGDASGWTTGVDYSTWASDKTFVVGDSLAFYYDRGRHSVAELSAADYDACSTSNNISSDSSGETVVPLGTAGRHYYACGVPGHCARGMKLAILVGAATMAAGPNSTSTAVTGAMRSSVVRTIAPGSMMMALLSVVVSLELPYL